MSNIFVSYRRSDSSGYTGRLMDDLENQFPRSQIFRDIEGIEPGMDFAAVIEDAVGRSLVLLAVIGPRWLSAANESGERRLDAAFDFVRHEIAAALRRNIRVIPVLVDGATPLREHDLPEEIRALARLQVLELSDRRWDYDVEQLLGVLGKVPGLTRQPRASVVPVSKSRPSRPVSGGLGVERGGGRLGLGIALGVAATALLVAGVLALARPPRGTAPQREPPNPAASLPTSVTTPAMEPSSTPTPPEPEPKPKLHLTVGNNPNVGDGGWPVYGEIDQVGRNGTDKRCRVRPKESVVATCKRERSNVKVSLVLRIENEGCAGYIASDAFLRGTSLPQNIYSLPRCPDAEK